MRIYNLNNQWVTWVGTRSKFFPSILLMCFLAWDVIWCLSRKENWQPSRMQWKWLFTWLYLQPTDIKPLLCSRWKVPRGKDTVGKMSRRRDKAAATWISGGLEITNDHGFFRNSPEWKKHDLLPAEQLQESVYVDLRSEPELQTSPIPLHFVIKKETLPLHLVVPNALQS